MSAFEDAEADERDMRAHEAEVGDGPLPPARTIPAAPAPASPVPTSHRYPDLFSTAPPAPRRGFGLHTSSRSSRMHRYVVEDPTGHGGCDTPAPLMWRRVTPSSTIPSANDLTLFVPRAGGMAKAIAVYGEVPLFGVTPRMSSPVDGLSDRIVHAAGDVTTGIPAGIQELVKIMVNTDTTSTLSTMSSSFVSLCVPCGSAGVCGCNAGSGGSGGKSCGQIIVAPLWSACDFDVWSTRLPDGLVPPMLSALDANTASGMILREDVEYTEADVAHGPRPQFYSCRTSEKPPRVFLGECCARTFIHQYARRVLRGVDSLPHPNVVDPVFGHDTAVVHVPVHRTPQGAPMSGLASTYSTFAPCSVPRVVAVDRRTPGLASAKLSSAQWTRVHGGEGNFLLILTKSVAGCSKELARDSLPAQCSVRLAPPPSASSHAWRALATPRTATVKRVRHEEEDQEEQEDGNEEAGHGAGASTNGGGAQEEYEDEH